MAEAPPALLPARWFDGQSSRPQKVLLGLVPAGRGPDLLLHPLATPGTAPRRFAHAAVGWPEAWNAGQRPPPMVVVDLGASGSLEIDDVAQWQALRAAAGAQAPLAERMQTRWRVFAAVLLVAGAALWAFYRWGTPRAATQLTQHVPLTWETQVATRGLEQLDARYLKPSQLPPERQAELREAFARLAANIAPDLRRYPGYAPTYTLQFRNGLGANALALPGGTIVVTDGLVRAAQRQGLPDDALLGVLAHELGHVVHRHTTRMVVEQGVLNVGLGLALGDVSSIVSMGSALLTGLAYQRSHEGEADCFAIALMARAQRPTAPMADLLLGIANERHGDKAGDQAGNKGASDDSASWTSWLSSHPDTPGRAQRLRAGQVQGCAA